MSEGLMTVAETDPFIRLAAKAWTDDVRQAFVDFIAANPDAGDLIPDTGGLRKVRWGRTGAGKCGGIRFVHVHHDDAMPLYLPQERAGKLNLG